jgi:CBS domain-containing protein
VLDGGQVIGILSQPAILRGLRDSGPEGKVRDVMTEARFAAVSTPLEQLLEELQTSETRLVCILRGKELVGLVDLENITEYLRIQAAMERN